MPQLKRTATGVLGGLTGLVGLSAIAGVLITATVTPAIAVSGYAATSAIDSFEAMPGFLQIDPLMMATEIYRKDSAGNDILMAQFYDQNRIPVTFEQVNPVMYDAIISSEDKNFYTHGGVDLLGTASALLGNAASGSNRGGSSITQQYVKNVLQQNCESKATSQEQVEACFTLTTASKGSEGYQRKLQEMRYAIQLEKRYSKDEILAGYLNITNFGGVVYGIGAAAQRYFSVPASELTIAQAATIAGMVQEPNTFRIDRPQGTKTDKAGNLVNSEADGYALTLKRRDYVLSRMLEDGKISQAEYDEAKASPIVPAISERDSGCQMAAGAEFFCESVVATIKSNSAFGETEEERATNLRRGGMKIYTTLDADLQNAALQAISVVPAYVDYMNLGASGVQVEVGTGRVLSMVQNRPYSIENTPDNAPTTQVNYNTTGHSAGSTYKMFSVINWLEQGHSVNEAINGRVGVKKVDTCDGAVQNVTADNAPGHVGNFEGNNGYTGTIYNFTRDSLNSGFLAMAETLSVCSTNRVAEKLGAVTAATMPNAPFDVLGSGAVSPLNMAEAYASVAANGILCKPRMIDLAFDAEGNDITPPLSCERVMSEAVASTTAYTLVGVMSGTGVGARIGDGVPVFGKTGIHEYEHTWMDGASTKVATVVWVGNVRGIPVDGVEVQQKLDRFRANGYQLSRIRNSIWPAMQGAANYKYGGDAFPTPDKDLTKQVLADLPSVIGMTVDQATQTLETAGFTVAVGDAIDGLEAAGTIIAQNPGAGKAASGSTVTITPSNGAGVTVPGVSGTPTDATAQLRSAGFGRVSAECSEKEDAPAQGVVTGTNPAAGTVVNRDAAITIQYQAASCGGRP